MSKLKFTEMATALPRLCSTRSQYTTDLPKRILEHLEMLVQGDHGGFAVDRYTHCLQTLQGLIEMEETMNT